MEDFKEKILYIVESKTKYLSKITLIDKVIRFLFLGLVPKFVTPNHITVFRFVSIPFIVTLLVSGHYLSASIIFMFSALSDALDGALARTTGQITRWGILADPLADKLLVGSIAVIFVSRFLSWQLAAVIVFIELLLLSSAYYRYKGKVVPAKTTGKIKMVFQCLGIIFLFFFVLFGGSFWLIFARIALYLAVIFALLSLLIYRSI
jgi:CDP-diacylglycerol--glycerol-3-phosphate 3-phosphatidyltransferase